MTYDSDKLGATHASVESLYSAAFGDESYPQASISAVGPRSIEIDLDGPESKLWRLTALAMFAGALGDDEGPEITPTMRYTCGEWTDGTFFLARLTVTQAEIDAEMEAL